MFITLIVGLIAAQLLNPLVLNFEHMVSLESALARQNKVAEAPERLTHASLGPVLTSRSAIVLDKDSREVLWSQGIYQSFPIASITKLMTALVFLESGVDLGETFTLSSQDMTVGGSVHIGQGERVLLRDMLYASLISSDNNSAKGLQRASGLPPEEFIARMNKRAQDIGMLHSNFKEVTGLSFTNTSSVQDVALLLEAALEHPIIRDASSRSRYTFTSLSGTTHTLYNTNKLLGSYLDVIGGKTGFNNEAQYNLAAAVQGDAGQTLLIVVLGSTSIDARFQDVKVLADWTFKNYSWDASN